MDTKKHYKLYKCGKQWKTAALTAVAVVAGLVATNVTANADTTASTDNNTVASSSVTTTVSSATSASSVTLQTSTSSQGTSSSVAASSSSVVVSSSTAASSATTGWQETSTGYTYYNEDGTTTEGRAYSYLPTIGSTDSSSYNWYLTDNGNVLSGIQEWAGSYWDFDTDTYTLHTQDDYVQSQWGEWYKIGSNGQVQSGVQQWAGTYYYFDPTTYLRVDNDYRQSQWGNWYLFGDDGKIETGVQQWAGTYYYFDPTTYLRVDNDYRQSQWGDWYMFGSDGRIVSGLYDWMGSTYYFDPSTYLKVTNTSFTVNGATYTADANGVVTSDATTTAVAKAMTALGIPYVWGGNTTAGFDCSGLVQWAYGLSSAYRTTYTQQTLGTHVYSNVSAAPYGALLFFGSDSAPYHVAISLGDGTYINAPEPGDVVKINSQKYFAPSYYVVIGQ